MAAITVTAANVTPGNDAIIESGLAGETVTAGMAVYYDTTTTRWKKAQCDGTAAEAGTAGLGVALNGASNGQPIDVQTGGTINIGGTAVVAAVYIVGATAGDITATADVTTTGHFRAVLGVGATASTLFLRPIRPPIALP